MVRLFNILFDGNTISCNYTPETSNDIGKVIVNANTREITSIDYSRYEYGKKMYVAHVRHKLSELLDLGQPIPKETTAIWF